MIAAWLGLSAVVLLIAGTALGGLVAGALAVPAPAGRVAGLICGFLVARSLLRRHFAGDGDRA